MATPSSRESWAICATISGVIKIGEQNGTVCPMLPSVWSLNPLANDFSLALSIVDQFPHFTKARIIDQS
jgi:hypothetical protein